MPRLAAAHAGYMYQGLMTAYLMAQAVIDGSSLRVDKKNFAGDVFDDISLTATGQLRRIQLKSSLADDIEFESQQYLQYRGSPSPYYPPTTPDNNVGLNVPSSEAWVDQSMLWWCLFATALPCARGCRATRVFRSDYTSLTHLAGVPGTGLGPRRRIGHGSNFARRTGLSTQARTGG